MSYSNLPEPLKKIVRPLFYLFLDIQLFLNHYFRNKEVSDYYKIPIIINNFNRLTYLQLLIEALESRGYKNIHIIDNASTYPPLLEYYNKCAVKVHKLAENMGYLALWKSGVYKQFKDQYYVYTDSDIVPIRECPKDFLKVFLQKLQKDPLAIKVGFSLKIDDLPNTYKLKDQVLALEKTYYYQKDEDGFYKANIDTTFALYKPSVKGGANLFRNMYRSPYPYVARHMPWYINSEKIDNEEQYYINSVKHSTHWSSLSKESNIQLNK